MPSPTDDAIYPWDRRPHETDRAYQAFTTYRDLGPTRSVRKVLEQHTTTNRTQACRWSRTFDWVDRASSYDDWLDREQRLASVEALKQMRRTHAAIAVLAISKAVTRLQNLDPARLSVRDAALLLDLGVKIERASRGDPSRIEIDATVEVTDNRRPLNGRQVLAILGQRPELAALAAELRDIPEILDV